MKKLLTICLLMATAFTANAQKLSGSLGTYSHNNIGNRYTNLNWEVSYKFEKRTNDGIYLIYYNPKVTVAQNSLYATAEKNYSKQELGLSAWPQNYSPASLNVSVSCRLPNGKVELSGFAFSTSDPYLANEDWVCATTLNGQEVNLSAFSLSIEKANYNPQPVEELDAIIKTKTANTSTINTQNSGSNNPLATSQSLTTQTNTQISSLESQYEKLGIPANTPTYTKSELTNQLVTQAGSLAGELLNDWNANYERKMALRDAANKAEIHAAYEKKTAKFKSVYLPLMDLAEKGDENARMILYFSSKELEREYLVPKREEWFKKALANNNTDALLYKAFISILSLKEDDEFPVAYVEALAEKGSVDAMMMLGDWYDRSDKSGFKTGGNNAKKALEWYEKAAAKGSPNAMYYLGMIYKYGKAKEISGPLRKWFVEYDVVPDEKIAFDWFTKSLQPNAIQSIYSNGTSYDYFLSEFEPKTYRELAYFYRKGKVVPKDKAKADELDFFLLYPYKNKNKYKYVD